MGITVVRAMARHRWRHSQYVGLTRVQLEHSGGGGRIGSTRGKHYFEGAGGDTPFRGSVSVVRMAQEHYFPWQSGGGR